MLDILLIVLPVFLIIGAGALATRSGVFPGSAVDGLNLFTQNFAIPVLLFAAMARLDLGAVVRPELLLSFFGGATIAFVLGILGARLLFARRPGEAVAIGFGALYSNGVLLGLPITARAFGPDALGPNYAIIAVHAPYCYLIGIVLMEIARADGRSALDTARVVLLAMFRNTIMIGIALGVAVNLSGFELPRPIWEAVELMARAALPAALFGLGGILTRYITRLRPGEALMISALSLILHPALVYLATKTVFSLPQGMVNSAVLTAAMAPGVNSFMFATMYNRAQDVAAGTVLIATALSVVTASGWLYLLGG